MRRKTHRTAGLGDMSAAVFDEAARYSAEPLEVPCLATEAVGHLMRRPRWISVPPLPAS